MTKITSLKKTCQKNGNFWQHNFLFYQFLFCSLLSNCKILETTNLFLLKLNRHKIKKLKFKKMKKLIYQRSIVLVQVFVLVVFLSCKKSEIKQIEKNKSKNEVIKYPERLPENYCEGCGTAYDPDYFCDLEDGCTNSEPPCGEEIINSISSLNNLSLTDNTNAAYDIRDSMVLRLKGKNYITYYDKTTLKIIKNKDDEILRKYNYGFYGVLYK